MKADYIALGGRIKQSLKDISLTVERTGMLMQKAKTTSDDGYLDGVALNLHGFYSGIERIFKDIAQTVEKTIPTGSDWHQDLLLQMSTEMPSIRPPVITQNTRHSLSEYKSFRHVVRNVYTFNIRPTRLQELVDDLEECFKSVVAELDDFITFLEKLSEE